MLGPAQINRSDNNKANLTKIKSQQCSKGGHQDVRGSNPHRHPHSGEAAGIRTRLVWTQSTGEPVSLSQAKSQRWALQIRPMVKTG